VLKDGENLCDGSAPVSLRGNSGGTRVTPLRQSEMTSYQSSSSSSNIGAEYLTRYYI
jgi:hypothetical protein